MAGVFNLIKLRRVYYMYMNRRLFYFPAVAATVWAQQASPAEEESKKALISRVQAYYQLMTEKKYRQAEAFVAEESKEAYYNGKKPDIRGFEILKVELLDGGKRATVTIKAKVTMLMMGAGAQTFEMPSPTNWILDNGQWYWFIPEEVRNATPFGKLKVQDNAGAPLDTKGKAPEVGVLLNQVTIDRSAVVLDIDKPEQTVTITNSLPGPVDLQIDAHVETIKGLAVKAEKLHLASGENTVVHLRWNGKDKISDTVEILAVPINRAFDIAVSTK